MGDMITGLLVSSLLGSMAIVVTERLRQKKVVSNETSRKVLHMAHGLVVAAWLFITTYSFIFFAEVLFLLIVVSARYLKIMQPMREVNRRSWGEVFFPLGIMLLALLNPTKEIFLVALLHLAVADALAALVGSRFKKGVYHVFGQRKTVAGTLTFLLTSIIIISLLVHLVPGYPVSLVFATPLLATIMENISPYGSDNLTLPLIILGLLTLHSRSVGL